MGAPAIPLVRKIDWVKIPRPGNPGKRKLFPSGRDLKIYELRQGGKSVSELADLYGLSNKRIWGICAEVKNYLNKLK